MILLCILGSCSDLAPDNILTYFRPKCEHMNFQMNELENSKITFVNEIIFSNFVRDLLCICATLLYNISLYIDNNCYIWLLNFIFKRNYYHSEHSVFVKYGFIRISIIPSLPVSRLLLLDAQARDDRASCIQSK